MSASSGRSERGWGKRALAAALLLAGTIMLGGCAASTIADNLPSAAGGLPEDAPKRPTEGGVYPAVYDGQPARKEGTLTAAERKRLEEDLIAAGKRASDAGAAGGSR